MIDYAPVNLGIAMGADGRLYVLSVPGFTTSESRIDAYDPVTGLLLRTARIPHPLPTVAVDEQGRLYLLDAFRLLTGIAPSEREAFAPFDLERLGSEHRMTLADLEGKVVLMNVWASWCAPCRVEMPALDDLQRSIEHPDFRFITMNEDVMVGDAQAFLEEHGFGFPVLLGRGRLQRQFHYMGLPFTVLLDREGRVVQRWTGFAGEEQIAGIRAVVQAELSREGRPGEHGGGHDDA
jgi:thiol-disulfide isomerase/thioredoxin